MATAHGAGLMLWPALMPLCQPGSEAGGDGPLAATLAGVGIHTLAMVTTTAVVAVIVFEWLGVGLLRQAWVDVRFALVACAPCSGWAPAFGPDHIMRAERSFAANQRIKNDSLVS